MSIIHDALKKLQQHQGSKTEGTPAGGANTGYIYSSETSAVKPEEQPIEHLQPAPNNAKSFLTLIFALAMIVGAFFFLYRQINIYAPDFIQKIGPAINKLFHKDLPGSKPKPPEPMARIAVAAPATSPAANVPVQTGLATLPPAAVSPAVGNAPKTLNVHGVMSNGTNNVVLINDQVYQEGDDVDGIKIVKITLNAITVNDNGVEKTIRVKH